MWQKTFQEIFHFKKVHHKSTAYLTFTDQPELSFSREIR